MPSTGISALHWLFKYKLHHLPFWIGYHFLWWTLRIGSPIDVINSLFLPHAAVKFLSYLIFQMIGVYFNLYFLIPRFLEKGRYFSYIILLLFTIIITAACIVSGYYFGAFISDRPFQELYGTDPHNYFSLFEGGSLPSTAAAMTLAMSIKLTRNWIQARQRAKELETEKLVTELKFLKAQINPHFLFNTINSIFVLINKNPAMASEALSKFSDLLRYQLYECNEHEIPLRQELSYLEGFIELERLRLDTNNVNVEFQLEQNSTQDLMIAPFLLIPFIENSFKHVSKLKNQLNWIKMNLRTNKNQLHFEIVNNISSHSPTREFGQNKGLGLANVQRRLSLIYPRDHTLNIEGNRDQFKVELHLNLHQEMHAQPSMLLADGR